MEKFFKLKENGTSVKIEFIAGITTFVTMAYIIMVNPAMLATPFEGTDMYDKVFNGVFLPPVCPHFRNLLNGSSCQITVCPGTWYGNERILYLHRNAWHGLFL